jgi:hypothetical protein
MPLTGAAKSDYMRDYHRRKRNGSPRSKTKTQPTCSFCGEAGSIDRPRIGDYDHTVFICAECVAAAAAKIAEKRRR